MYVEKVWELEGGWMPYCDVCGIDDDDEDMYELHLEGDCHGAGFRLCPDCRGKLVEIIKPTLKK